MLVSVAPVQFDRGFIDANSKRRPSPHVAEALSARVVENETDITWVARLSRLNIDKCYSGQWSRLPTHVH